VLRRHNIGTKTRRLGGSVPAGREHRLSDLPRTLSQCGFGIALLHAAAPGDGWVRGGEPSDGVPCAAEASPAELLEISSATYVVHMLIAS